MSGGSGTQVNSRDRFLGSLQNLSLTGQPEGVDKVEGSAICSLVENTDEEIFASFSEIEDLPRDDEDGSIQVPSTLAISQPCLVTALADRGVSAVADGRQDDLGRSRTGSQNGSVQPPFSQPSTPQMRTAPAKPKCLAPPMTSRPAVLSKKQSSIESEVEVEDNLTYHRAFLFDQCEKTEERLKRFIQDAKAENLSVQGEGKFMQVVSYNKQLRQFKVVHDRNMVLCQESLREASIEDSISLSSRRLSQASSRASVRKDSQASISERRLSGQLHNPLPNPRLNSLKPVNPKSAPTSSVVETTFPADSDEPIQQELGPSRRESVHSQSTRKESVHSPSRRESLHSPGRQDSVHSQSRRESVHSPSRRESAHSPGSPSMSKSLSRQSSRRSLVEDRNSVGRERKLSVPAEFKSGFETDVDSIEPLDDPHSYCSTLPRRSSQTRPKSSATSMTTSFVVHTLPRSNLKSSYIGGKETDIDSVLTPPSIRKTTLVDESIDEDKIKSDFKAKETNVDSIVELPSFRERRLLKERSRSLTPSRESPTPSRSAYLSRHESPGTRAYHTLDRVAQGTPATSTRRPPKVTRWHSTNVDDISFEKSYHEEFRPRSRGSEQTRDRDSPYKYSTYSPTRPTSSQGISTRYTTIPAVSSLRYSDTTPDLNKVSEEPLNRPLRKDPVSAYQSMPLSTSNSSLKDQYMTSSQQSLRERTYSARESPRMYSTSYHSQQNLDDVRDKDMSYGRSRHRTNEETRPFSARGADNETDYKVNAAKTYESWKEDTWDKDVSYTGSLHRNKYKPYRSNLIDNEVISKELENTSGFSKTFREQDRTISSNLNNQNETTKTVSSTYNKDKDDSIQLPSSFSTKYEPPVSSIYGSKFDAERSLSKSQLNLNAEQETVKPVKPRDHSLPLSSSHTALKDHALPSPAKEKDKDNAGGHVSLKDQRSGSTRHKSLKEGSKEMSVLEEYFRKKAANRKASASPSVKDSSGENNTSPIKDLFPALAQAKIEKPIVDITAKVKEEMIYPKSSDIDHIEKFNSFKFDNGKIEKPPDKVDDIKLVDYSKLFDFKGTKDKDVAKQNGIVRHDYDKPIKYDETKDYTITKSEEIDKPIETSAEVKYDFSIDNKFMYEDIKRKIDFNDIEDLEREAKNYTPKPYSTSLADELKEAFEDSKSSLPLDDDWNISYTKPKAFEKDKNENFSSPTAYKTVNPFKSNITVNPFKNNEPEKKTVITWKSEVEQFDISKSDEKWGESFEDKLEIKSNISAHFPMVEPKKEEVNRLQVFEQNLINIRKGLESIQKRETAKAVEVKEEKVETFSAFKPGFLLPAKDKEKASKDAVNQETKDFMKSIGIDHTINKNQVQPPSPKKAAKPTEHTNVRFMEEIKFSEINSNNFDNNNTLPNKDLVKKYPSTDDVKNELNQISKEKQKIEDELKKMSNENLKRLLHVSPSPTEFTMTDKLTMFEDNLIHIDDDLEEMIRSSQLDNDNLMNDLGSGKKKTSLDSVGSNSSRHRRLSAPTSPEDMSLKSERSLDSEDDNVRFRRKSGPAVLKPVLKFSNDTNFAVSSTGFPGLKKSVTFSSVPKIATCQTEADKQRKLERRKSLERIPIKPIGDMLDDTKVELEEIFKQKEIIEKKLKEMNDKNLQRLLHVSPSPEELTITEQMAKDKEEGNTLETYLRPLILKSSVGGTWDPEDKAINPTLKVTKGPLPPRMIRPRSPYPPMHLIQSGRIRVGGPKGPPNGARMSPPLRHMPMFYRMPSPTAGLIRVTPRHLPPTAYRMNMGNRPRMLTPSPIQNQRYSRLGPIAPPRSPLRKLRCSGQFSPLRPPHFRPQYYMGAAGGPPSPRPLPPSAYGAANPTLPGAGAKPMTQPVAVKEGTKIIVSKPPTTDGRGVPGGHQGAQQTRPYRISKANLQDVKLVRPGTSALQQNKEKIIKVKGYGTVKITTPEMATITSDLLSAYRLSQSLSGARPYKYTPNENPGFQRRLSINSMNIFEKLSSPKDKGPYVPNRDVIRLFRNDQRGREKLAMENEELLYKHKETYERTGEFFGPKNAEVLEKFQQTHEYIKRLYEHSKSNLIPPGDEFADVHERVKYFCGVTNEELLEKLRTVEERVRNAEWFTRVQDTKARMESLYNENKEFLEKFKKEQEKRVNDLLDENKELIESIKVKAQKVDEGVRQGVDIVDKGVRQGVDIVDKGVREGLQNIDKTVEAAAMEVL